MEDYGSTYTILKPLGKSSAFPNLHSWRSSSAEAQTTDPTEWTAERVLGAAALPSGPEEMWKISDI